MNPDEFDALVQSHGGIVGYKALNPTVPHTTTDPTTGQQITIEAVKEKNPYPQTQYTFKDGTHITVAWDFNSHQWSVLDGGTALKDKATTSRLQVVKGPDGNFYEVQPDGSLKQMAGGPGTSKTSVVQGSDGQIYQIQDDGSLKLMPGGPTAKTVGGQDVAAYNAQTERQNSETSAFNSQTARQNANTEAMNADTSRMRAEADAKAQALNAQVAQGRLTMDQAAQQFDQWYKMNVELPLAKQKQDMATQQQKLDLLTFGQNAGRIASQNALATLPYRVGPSFGSDFAKALATLSGGGGQVNFNPGDFTFQLPDLNAIAHQGAVEALKGLSPMATQMAASGPAASGPAASGASMPGYPAPPLQDPSGDMNSALMAGMAAK